MSNKLTAKEARSLCTKTITSELDQILDMIKDEAMGGRTEITWTMAYTARPKIEEALVANLQELGYIVFLQTLYGARELVISWEDLNYDDSNNA